MPAPVAKKLPRELTIHNDTRIDNYFWLNERENPEVIAYLNAENKYTQTEMQSTSELQKKLFSEIVGRIKEDDESVPYFKNSYYYYSRFVKGAEHRLYCRKNTSPDAPEEILLDAEKEAAQHAYYSVDSLAVSPDNKLLCYGEDTVSRRIYTLRFKNLESGKLLDKTIAGTTGVGVWSSNSKTVFYVERDPETLRACRVKSYNLETGKTKLHFEEEDDTFYCSIKKSRDLRYILLLCSSTITTEYHYLNSDEPEAKFEVFQPRIRGMEYHISHRKDRWILITNWEAQNFRVMATPENQTDRSNWKELLAHKEDTLIEQLSVFAEFMVLQERSMGLNQLHIFKFETAEDYYVPFDSEPFWIGDSDNPEFESTVYRYRYSSMTTPMSVVDFDISSKTTTVRKEQEVVGGYDKSQYESKRIWATARDGIKVPVSIVYKKSMRKNGPQQLLLYGYGSYGSSTPSHFSTVRLSLLDRGFIYAVAHIRGGEEMGRQWYESGKMLQKKNTFFDFIDCAEYLIAEGYTSADHLYARGGSAGGLLMGAIANFRPDLWKGILAAVPFVDVVTTMLDDSIPLTTFEYDEWGNPNEETFYRYIKSYSPYDNVEAKGYPHMLITTGLHDSQVQYWEPAKWVARLRELKTDDNLLLFRCNMESGHGGASGRYKAHKDTALEYAFILMLEGVNS